MQESKLLAKSIQSLVYSIVHLLMDNRISVDLPPDKKTNLAGA